MSFFKEHGIELPSIEEADSQDNPLAIAHFSNGAWDWFVIGGKELDNGDFYLYGLVNGYDKELGMFTLKQIQSVGAIYDEDFQAIGVFDIYEDFDLRGAFL